MEVSRRTALAGVALAVFVGAIALAMGRREGRATPLPEATAATGVPRVDDGGQPHVTWQLRIPRESAPASLPSFVEVCDAATDRALPGVVVELLDTRGNAIARRATDARGRVDFVGGVPPPGGVVCRHPGYRLAGRFDLLEGNRFRLERARTVDVQLASVPPWLGSWVLEAEMRYPKAIAAARALGNHATVTRLADYVARAAVDAERAVLPVEIETWCEVAIVGHPPAAAAREELASVSLLPGQDHVVVDLREVRRDECVYALHATVELPAGYAATSVRVHHERLPELDASPCVASLRGPAAFDVARLCESDYEIDVTASNDKDHGGWLLMLGPVSVNGDADLRWRFDFQPQVYARVVNGGDRPMVSVHREDDGRRAECALHWLNERELVVAGLVAGRYRIAADVAWREGASFAIEPRAQPIIELVLNALPSVEVMVKIEAGSGRGSGTLVVRDLDTGRWLERPTVTVGRIVPQLELRLPPGRYAVQVSYPDKFLERAVEVPRESRDRIDVVLR